MKPTIEILIDNDGNVKMEGIGFKGTACDLAMKKLEDAIGVPVERKNKPEYAAIVTTTAKQQVGGG